MATDILDDVIGDHEAAADKRRRAAEAAFRTLVRDVATGKRPTPDRLEKAMEAAGRSADDLRAAVLAHQQRQADADAVTAAATLPAERAAVAKQLDDVWAELAAAQSRLAAKAEPLRRRLAEVEQQQRAADDARARLARDCPYPEAVADLEANRFQQAEMVRRAIDCRQAADGLDRAAQLRADVAAYRAGKRDPARDVPGVDPTWQWETEAARLEQDGRGAAAAAKEADHALAALRAREPELVRQTMAV